MPVVPPLPHTPFEIVHGVVLMIWPKSWINPPCTCVPLTTTLFAAASKAADTLPMLPTTPNCVLPVLACSVPSRFFAVVTLNCSWPSVRSSVTPLPRSYPASPDPAIVNWPETDPYVLKLLIRLETVFASSPISAGAAVSSSVPGSESDHWSIPLWISPLMLR